MMMGKMTRADREELGRLLRKRTVVAKSMVDERGKAIIAEFERQLATVFEAEDKAWRDLTVTANAGVKKLDAMLAARCDALGIPRQFRPRLQVGWYGRGANASKERQAELRRVCQTQVEAQKRAAYARLEAEELDGRMLLARDGLESEEAHAFLAAMPPPEALMPPLPAIDVLKLTRSSPQEVAAELAASVKPTELAALLRPPEPEEAAPEVG
jgi:hypothetical protein